MRSKIYNEITKNSEEMKSIVEEYESSNLIIMVRLLRQKIIVIKNVVFFLSFQLQGTVNQENFRQLLEFYRL